MAFLKFNKLPKHRTFNYVPRYYDERKEELDKIVNRVQKEGDSADVSRLRERISHGMKKGYSGKTAARKEIMSSNVRLLFIIIFLCLAALLLLNLNIDKLLELV